jgi:hypothetical protein
MAFPWIAYENFEDGLGTTVFDGTWVDTGNRLSVDHYSELARFTNVPAPYRGAYCLHVDCGASAADSYALSGNNIAADGATFFKFKVFLSNDLTLAASGEVALFSLMASTTTELTISLRNNAGVFQLGLTNGPAATTANTRLDISTGVWHTVRLAVNIDAGGCDDGDATLTLDGASSTLLGSLDQGAITDMRLGVDTDALTTGTSPTAGHILFDEFYEDDAALVDDSDRWSENMFLTATGHAFVGPGWIKSLTLQPQAGAADQLLTVYDTDIAAITDPSNRKIILTQDAQLDKTMVYDTPVYFKRGAYVVITGTAAATGPFAIVNLKGVHAFGSDAAVRNKGRVA